MIKKQKKLSDVEENKTFDVKGGINFIIENEI